MVHGDPPGPVSAHGMADQAAARSPREGAVVAVDIVHHVLGDEALEVAGGGRVRIHAAAELGVGVRQDDDELLTLGGCRQHGLRYVHEGREPAAGDAEAVQEIEHRIATARRLGVARRQHHHQVAVDRIALEVALQRLAMDLDHLARGAGTGRLGRGPEAGDRRRRRQHSGGGLSASRDGGQREQREAGQGRGEATVHGDPPVIFREWLTDRASQRHVLELARSPGSGGAGPAEAQKDHVVAHARAGPGGARPPGRDRRRPTRHRGRRGDRRRRLAQGV